MSQFPVPVCLQFSIGNPAGQNIVKLPSIGNNQYKINISTCTTQLYTAYNGGQQAYDSTSMVAGNWICGVQGGYAWRIIEVVTASGTSATLIVEDVNNYNSYIDPLGSGAPQVSSTSNSGYIYFEVNSDGVPIFAPLYGVSQNTSAIPFIPSDIMSRFANVNPARQFVNIFQAGNTFNVGDPVWLNPSTQLYAISNNANAAQTIGIVTSVNNPAGWFTFKCAGTYYNNLSSFFIQTGPSFVPFTLSQYGPTGTFIYVDTSGTRQYTGTAPTSNAVPVWVYMGTDKAAGTGYTGAQQTAILMSNFSAVSGGGGTTMTGPTGYTGPAGPIGAGSNTGPTGPFNTDITLNLSSGTPVTGTGISINSTGSAVIGFVNYVSNSQTGTLVYPSPQVVPQLVSVNGIILSIYALAGSSNNNIYLTSVVVPSPCPTGTLSLSAAYNLVGDGSSTPGAWNDGQMYLASLPTTTISISLFSTVSSGVTTNYIAPLNVSSGGLITPLTPNFQSTTGAKIMGALGLSSSVFVMAYTDSSANLNLVAIQYASNTFTQGTAISINGGNGTSIGNTVIIQPSSISNAFVASYTLWNGTSTSLYFDVYIISSLTLSRTFTTSISSNIYSVQLLFGLDTINTSSNIYLLQYTTPSAPILVPLSVNSSSSVTIGSNFLLSGYSLSNLQPSAMFPSTTFPNGWIVARYSYNNMITFIQIVYSALNISLSTKNLLCDYMPINNPIVKNFSITGTSQSDIVSTNVLYDASYLHPNFICNYIHNPSAGNYILGLTPPAYGSEIVGLAVATNGSNITVRTSGILNFPSSIGVTPGFPLGVDSGGNLQANNQSGSVLLPVGVCLSSTSVLVNLK